MKFYLIRHGQMAGDPHRPFIPPVSGCLSEKGQSQAAAMGRALAPVVFDHVYASPLGRALQTAQELKTTDKRTIEVLDWLIEWRPAHVMNGSDDANFERMCAAAAALPPEQTWKTPAGEGTLEMAARIVPGWVGLLESLGIHSAHGGYLLDDPADARNIALVAHGGSLGHLLAFILSIPIRPHPPIAFLETGVAVVALSRQGDVWYPKLEIAPPCSG